MHACRQRDGGGSPSAIVAMTAISPAMLYALRTTSQVLLWLACCPYLLGWGIYYTTLHRTVLLCAMSDAICMYENDGDDQNNNASTKPTVVLLHIIMKQQFSYGRVSLLLSFQIVSLFAIRQVIRLGLTQAVHTSKLKTYTSSLQKVSKGYVVCCSRVHEVVNMPDWLVVMLRRSYFLPCVSG